MIDELRARDVALIRDATIRPAAGLTVLTGETGAGKTALLSALKLLVGERADASMVREGAPELVVEGRVFVPGGDPDGCIVRRRVGADGRGRVEVDGGMAVFAGRLREDTVYDWKFVGLSHNTLRGAAGGAVLSAELLTAQGKITKK